MKLLKLNIQMFADGKVVIETDLDKNGFESGLNKMQSIAKTGFNAIATSVGVVATAMTALLGYGVKYNAEIEQLKTSFEVMTGSADKASEVIEKLKEVGAKTPYELKGLAQTTQTLMQYGLSADEAYEATLNFGDIAQGSAEKMQSIALAYGQMSSAGKVNMQDIRQMINAGFNPLQAIAEMTGETMQEVTARYEENAISVEEVTEAMRFASSEGGKFYQSMEKQSKTLSGQISTLQDNFSSLAGTLSKGLSETISGEVLPTINDLLTNLESAFTEGGISGLADALGEGLANIVTALTEEAPKFIEIAILIIENLITGIQNNLPTIVQSAISIITMLNISLINMLPQILQMGITLLLELIKGISEALPELIPTMVKVIMDMVNILLDNIDLIIEAGIQILIALIDGIINALPELVVRLPEIIIKIVATLINLLPEIIAVGIRVIGSLITGIFRAVPELVIRIPELIARMVNGLMEGIKDFANVGVNLVKGLWNGIKDSYSWIKNKIKGWVGDVMDFIKGLFGIHSPSTVMRDEVGKYLAQGLGVGFDNELDSVYNDMQRAIDLETGKMTASVQASGTYQMAMVGTPTFNLLDNSEHSTQLVVNGKILAEVVNTENKNREVATA